MAEKRGLETENGKADTAISFAAATSISLLASQWWNIRENILEMLAVMRVFIYFVQSQGGGWTAKVDYRGQGFESQFPLWVLSPQDCSNYDQEATTETALRNRQLRSGIPVQAIGIGQYSNPSEQLEDSSRMGNDWKFDCRPECRPNRKKEGSRTLSPDAWIFPAPPPWPGTSCSPPPTRCPASWLSTARLEGAGSDPPTVFSPPKSKSKKTCFSLDLSLLY